MLVAVTADTETGLASGTRNTIHRSRNTYSVFSYAPCVEFGYDIPSCTNIPVD